MRNLLAVALMLGVAFAATMFIGSVLERRAEDLQAVRERARPISSLATAPSSLTPETPSSLTPETSY
jgi:Na+/H+ antiporter NhaA